MPIPQRPVNSLDDINQRRRDRETLNQIVTHEFDDSRVQTQAEIAAGVTPINKAYPPGDVRRYGAVSSGGDISQAVRNALLASNDVWIPSGIWRQDTTVQIEADKRVTLGPSALVTRYSAHSAATTPLYWLHGSRAGLVGSGQNSRIRTENRAPDGVVLIGHESMTVSHADVLNCDLRNLRIGGSTNYGQVAGNPDACVKVINPQIGGLASYFHKFSGLFLDAANYGLWLQGWANANTIDGMHYQAIGNGTLKSAAIYLQGALENTGAGAFFHDAPDSTMIRIEDYDNTGTTGGVLHVASYNSLLAQTCEQGGATSTGFVANANCTAFANFFEIRDNAAGGNDASATVLENNSFVLSSAGALLPSLTVQTLATMNGRIVVNKARVLSKVNLTFGAAVALPANTGSFFQLVCTSGAATAVSAPSGGVTEQVINIQVVNTSGGALALTWNAAFKMAAWVSPATGFNRAIQFKFDGTNWYEQFRSPADIPN